MMRGTYQALYNIECNERRKENALSKVNRLEKERSALKAKIQERFEHIINGEGLTIPRIAVKIAVDEILSMLEEG